MENKSAERMPLENTSIPLKCTNWIPKVINGSDEPEGDIEKQELWNWYVARIRALSGFGVEQVQLTALLGWTENQMTKASRAARIGFRSGNFTDEVPDSYLSYLAADYLARKALDLEIPEGKTLHRLLK